MRPLSCIKPICIVRLIKPTTGACIDIFQKGFTNFLVLNLPLKYAYLRYALPVKYAFCVLRNIYPKKSVFKMLFTAQK